MSPGDKRVGRGDIRGGRGDKRVEDPENHILRGEVEILLINDERGSRMWEGDG